MKRQFLILPIATLTFMLGLGFNNIAKSDVPINFKVGIVDVNAVVSKSSQVLALKKEQAKKMQDLQKWLDVVKKDIEKQSTDENKQKLAKKYSAEFTKKRSEIQKDYTEQLKKIDKDISAIIANEAKKQNYNLILSKSTVLYGGDDITGVIINAVK